jgi:GAF domain-containing protein
MNGTSREDRITDAFVAMTDALMQDYDIVELLSTLLNLCTDVLPVEARGILIVDAAGDLELVASSSEEARVVETIIIAAGAGPCIDCFTSGAPVIVADIAGTADAWPRFHDTALEQGFHSSYALPMRLRDQVIGVMNLLGSEPGTLSEKDRGVAQALADIAVLGILHERNFRKPESISEQLHLALDSRILIEQAKGVLSHGEALTMSESFEALRSYARAHGITLRAAAELTVRREVTTTQIIAEYAPAIAPE